MGTVKNKQGGGIRQEATEEQNNGKGTTTKGLCQRR